MKLFPKESQEPVALYSSDGHFNNEILSVMGEKISKFISRGDCRFPYKKVQMPFCTSQIKRNIDVFANTVQQNTENGPALTGISQEMLNKSQKTCA